MNIHFRSFSITSSTRKRVSNTILRRLKARITSQTMYDQWVRCDMCEKWRMLLSHKSAERIPEKWYCSMNRSDPINNICDATEKSAKWYLKTYFDVTENDSVPDDLEPIKKEDLNYSRSLIVPCKRRKRIDSSTPRNILDTETKNVVMRSKQRKRFDKYLNIDQDVIVRKRIYEDHTKKWSKWQVIVDRQSATQTSYNFPMGLEGSNGTLRVYLNILNHQELHDISTDILKSCTSHLFRTYKIQGVQEPRIHLLFHEDATCDFEK